MLRLNELVCCKLFVTKGDMAVDGVGKTKTDKPSFYIKIIYQDGAPQSFQRPQSYQVQNHQQGAAERIGRGSPQPSLTRVGSS
ncbi:unnamed protein product [Arctia plantaginis]|uniref:Uncharacterized protein n=1 Tax=Arctia plantaginis TaxID=874455 RepID=A0A8S1A6F8_ARCPL|nr:unnamed protein product [Arctia plantaginis]